MRFFWKCVLWGTRVGDKSLHVKCRPQVLEYAFIWGLEKCSIPLHVLNGPRTFLDSQLWLEGLKFVRFRLVWEEWCCMGMGGREFPLATNRYTPFGGWRKQNFWVLWPFEKSKIHGSPWKKFCGLGLSFFQGRNYYWALCVCVCTYMCNLLNEDYLKENFLCFFGSNS